MNEKGFNKLQVKTNKKYALSRQLHYAGYLEGYITATDISNYYQNVYTEFDASLNKTSVDFDKNWSAFTAYITQSKQSTYDRYKANPNSKQFALQVTVYKWTHSIYKGYRARYSEYYNIPDFDIQKYDAGEYKDYAQNGKLHGIEKDNKNEKEQSNNGDLAYIDEFGILLLNIMPDIDSTLKMGFKLSDMPILNFIYPKITEKNEHKDIGKTDSSEDKNNSTSNQENPNKSLNGKGINIDDIHNNNISKINSSKCSAVVKLTMDYSDLMVAHSTWQNYTVMYKTLKYYEFFMDGFYNLVLFDSYPGVVGSNTDFIVDFSNKMVYTETNLQIYSQELVDFVVLATERNFNFINTVSSVLIAANNNEFTNYYPDYNAKLFANSFISVDYKKFEPKVPIQQNQNIVMVTEVIPGYSQSKDVTSDHLTSGYFPSFNIPYTKDLYYLSGIQLLSDKVTRLAFGMGELPEYAAANFNSWGNNPRAQLMRKYNSSIVTAADMLKVFRINDPATEKYQWNHPSFALMSRGDLVDNPDLMYSYGGTDTKVVDYDGILNRYIYVNASPTHETLPPFEWTHYHDKEQKNGINKKTRMHKGHPDKWDFKTYKEYYTLEHLFDQFDYSNTDNYFDYDV